MIKALKELFSIMSNLQTHIIANYISKKWTNIREASSLNTKLLKNTPQLADLVHFHFDSYSRNAYSL